MDRTSTRIAVLLACIVLFQGCDFLRGVAGRPLSGEIAAKRDALESARIADSLKVAAEREAAQAAARHAADSVSALQFFADKAVALKSSSEVRGVSFAGYDSR